MILKNSKTRAPTKFMEPTKAVMTKATMSTTTLMIIALRGPRGGGERERKRGSAGWSKG